MSTKSKRLMMKPFSNRKCIEFKAKMDFVYEQHEKELKEAMNHLDNATLLLELLASTARSGLEHAYYDILPDGERLGKGEAYLKAVKENRTKSMSEEEKAGKMFMEIMVGNFFPETMHCGLDLHEVSFCGWGMDRRIFRFTWGKERIEVWAPNLDMADSQGHKPSDVIARFDVYSKYHADIWQKFNWWKTTVYHITEERGVDTMHTVAESYDPGEIREQLSKWLEDGRAGK